MAASKTVIAFDLYGTLLSTESIAGELAKRFGDDTSKTAAALWRRYQLEYSWRITSMGLYRPWSDITRGALLHTAAELGLTLSDDDVGQLMKSYDALRSFADVTKGLETVASTDEIDAYVFSNGTDDMVQASIATSPDLKPHAGTFKGLLTIHSLQAFKPARKVYDDLLQKVDKAGQASDVWLVSSNPFDVVGARAAGLHAAWVDRAGKGWLDRLGDVIGGIEPTIVVSGVDEAVAQILKA
ncbi:haloacid dehalogenase [Thozetella sp. PMI_491]|nr:haloacid dehalogenase [Thozetella sp. PMI_491]